MFTYWWCIVQVKHVGQASLSSWCEGTVQLLILIDLILHLYRVYLLTETVEWNWFDIAFICSVFVDWNWFDIALMYGVFVDWNWFLHLYVVYLLTETDLILHLYIVYLLTETDLISHLYIVYLLTEIICQRRKGGNWSIQRKHFTTVSRDVIFKPENSNPD